MAASAAAYTNAGSWILSSARFRHRIPSHFSVRVSTIFAVRKEKQARKFYGRPLGGKKHVKNLVWLVGAPNVVVWIMFKPWLVGWNKLKYHIPYHTLQVPYRYPRGILQVPSPIPGHPQYLSYLLAPPGTLLAALRGWRSEPHHTADLPPWGRPNGISKWTGFGSYVVGRRLIERRQLLCVFLSRLLFSRVLALSMGWGGVGY